MSDIVDAATRSRMMSRIRGKDTNIEFTVRRFIHKNGIRFRLHRKDLPGRPDIYVKKFSTVIFVHGCFWHGHHCHLFRLPKTRTAWWSEKITRNRERDLATAAACRQIGLTVIEVWECSLRGKRPAEQNAFLGKIFRKLLERSIRATTRRARQSSAKLQAGPA